MPVIHIKGLQLNLEFNNGKSTTINAKNFEFSALNVTYNLDDLSKNNSHLNKLKEALGNKNLTLEEMKSAEYADKIAYTTVDGNIPYFWRISQPNDFVTSGVAKIIPKEILGLFPIQSSSMVPAILTPVWPSKISRKH